MTARLGLIVPVLLGLMLLSVNVGAAEITLRRASTDAWTALVLMESRLPRTLAVMLSGAALAVAGVLIQALVRNRFVGPDTSGTSESAAMPSSSRLSARKKTGAAPPSIPCRTAPGPMPGSADDGPPTSTKASRASRPVATTAAGPDSRASAVRPRERSGMSGVTPQPTPPSAAATAPKAYPALDMPLVSWSSYRVAPMLRMICGSIRKVAVVRIRYGLSASSASATEAGYFPASGSRVNSFGESGEGGRDGTRRLRGRRGGTRGNGGRAAWRGHEPGQRTVARHTPRPDTPARRVSRKSHRLRATGTGQGGGRSRRRGGG